MSTPRVCRSGSFLRTAAAAFVLAVAAVATVQAASWRKMPPYAAGFPHLFPRPTDIRPREGALVAADPDRDGAMELVVSVPSGVLTIVGRDGATLAGWPRRFTELPQPAWPVGRPGIGDLDGDGLDEIVTCVTAGAPDRRSYLYALSVDGALLPGWPVEMAAAPCSLGATIVADLDGDGRAEVVRAEGSRLHGYDGDGLPLPYWPWQAPPDAAGRGRWINADPIAADLDADGLPEIVAIESGYEPRVFAVSLGCHTLTPFPILLGQVVDRQAPAGADVDGDGRAEIIQATLPFDGDFLEGARVARAVPGPESTVPGPLVPASLHMLRSDGAAAPGWPLALGDSATHGALLVDLEGDGRLSILQGDGDRVEGYDALGTPLRGFPLIVRGMPRGAEARFDTAWSATDLDGDGGTDLLRASGFLEAGAASLRVVGLGIPTGSARGYPFLVDGVLPSSPIVAVDMNGDAVPEVAILVSEGTNGGWRLLAWNVAAAKN